MDHNYYFTFGSDPGFPYQNGYLIVHAKDRQTAVALFSAVHPPREAGSNIINCSDVYLEVDWQRNVARYYEGQLPYEIINICVMKPEYGEEN